jgi:hypothetical protein
LTTVPAGLDEDLLRRRKSVIKKVMAVKGMRTRRGNLNNGDLYREVQNEVSE